MIILGIESTCDETGCAVVRDGKEILSNVVASQTDVHEQYGGVFPELAARRHADVILPIIDQALTEARITLEEIDLIAVANGPGLMGALLVGLNTAKALSLSLKKPLIGINHVEAHLYASLMSHIKDPTMPCLGVVLSGGHTHLVHMKALGHYELLGQTADDAIGEAFDKVARMLDLPFPGGPQIEKLALKGDPLSHTFKVGQIKKRPLDFSFSGIKTGVLYTVKGQNSTIKEKSTLNDSQREDIAASFQHTVFTDIIKKTLKAALSKNCETIVFGGGVTNNQHLRHMFSQTAPNHNLLWPSVGLSLDNAAMIAGLAYHQFQASGPDTLHLEALTRIPMM